MYAYCLNNPIIFGDPYGQDAIILLNSNGTGHLGIMVQDECGKWWHFYWGPSKVPYQRLLKVIAFFGISIESSCWCVEYTGDITLDAINASDQYKNEYDDLIYLEGDFYQCLEELNTENGPYNLYSRNCSQVSLNILSHADTIYDRILLKASGCLLPARAFSYIKKRVDQDMCLLY